MSTPDNDRIILAGEINSDDPIDISSLEPEPVTAPANVPGSLLSAPLSSHFSYQCCLRHLLFNINLKFKYNQIFGMLTIKVFSNQS